MGLTYPNIAMLGNAKARGVSFREIVTIGRQYLFLPANPKSCFAAEFADFDFSRYSEHQFADQFLKDFLDSESVDSIDVSDYEGCTIVSDLNHRVETDLHGRFDAVIDGGSLEHIFDVKTALENYMNLLRPNGSLFIFTTANNHMGHGFYQFSPELFFNVFSETNGFETISVVLDEHPYPGVELSDSHRLYTVSDPSAVRSRVGLVSSRPAMIMVHAVKRSLKPLFATSPVQSDYRAAHAAESVRSESLAKRVFGILPSSVRNLVHGIRQRKLFSFRNRRFFGRIG
jgi:SAM-dependent methyltransferase